jgi:hypothetical protein
LRRPISLKLVPCGFTTSAQRTRGDALLGRSRSILHDRPQLPLCSIALSGLGRDRSGRDRGRDRIRGRVPRTVPCRAFPRFTFATLSTRLLELMTLLQETALFGLEQRVAAFLLRRSGNGHVLETTHEQVAHDLGSSREVVSRVLRNIARSGAIRLSPGSVAIVDADKLRSAVE